MNIIDLDDVLGFVVDRDEYLGLGRMSGEEIAKLADEMLTFFDARDEYEYDPDSCTFLLIPIGDVSSRRGPR